MLPKSESERLVRLSLLKGEPTTDTARRLSARTAIAYHDDNAEGTAMSKDLTTYYASLYDGNAVGLAKWNARKKVCFNLLAPIASALCSTHDDPVRYAWDKKLDPKGIWAGMFAEFRNEHVEAMADGVLYSWLGGTSGLRPMITEDKGPLRYALYTGDQLDATQDPVDPAIPGQLVISWSNGVGSARTETRHHWTADGFFKTVDGKPHFDKWEDEAYPGGVHPYGIIPVVLVHHRRPRWSCFALPPMDVVNINRAVNKKATDLDWRMTLVGDVLVTQNLQLPEGATGPTVGAGAWLDHGDNGSVSFTGPDPHVDDAVATMNEYIGKALMSRRIPENAIMARQSGESGIKVVADSEALSGFRKKLCNIIRPKEELLIRIALFTYALHHGKVQSLTLDKVPAPSIFYTIPQAPMSADRRSDWDRRIRLNLATAVDELLDLEPALSREEAEERIKLNAEYNAQQEQRQFPGFVPGQRKSTAQATDEEDADADA